MLLRVIAGILVLFGVYQCWNNREVSQPPGILTPNQPIQRTIANPEPFDFRGYRITPLAFFEIEAASSSDIPSISSERSRGFRLSDALPE